MTHPVPYRPLGLIKELLEAQQFTITHCYEDLVFVEHNPFLLQMGDRGEEVFLIFNTDCKAESRELITHQLQTGGRAAGLSISTKGTYTMSPNEADNTIDITFIE